MTIFICLDDNGGMMFGRRRQSRDRSVCEDIAKTVGGGRLLLRPYSAPLFSGLTVGKYLSELLAKNAKPGDFCLLEIDSVAPLMDRTNRVVIYRWNRVYPADAYFNIDLAAEGFELVESSEFAGTSHERITKEIYERR